MIESSLKDALKKAVKSLGFDLEGEVLLEHPREASHGDLASPVAMILASQAKCNPKKLAIDIVDRLVVDDQMVKEVQVMGPGFINFTFTDSYFQGVLREIIEDGEDYGKKESSEKKRKLMVEFVSSNPTGPLTIGHGRQAALGDIIANMLEWAGHDVTREYYFNDAGRQMELLGRSVYARYAQLFDAEYPFPEDGYQGDYLIDIARAIKKEKGEAFLCPGGEPSAEVLDQLRLEGAGRIVKRIKEDLEEFRITFDSWFVESSLIEDGRTADVIETFKKSGAYYKKDKAEWFKASEYGDEEDRVLVKSGGDHTYFLTDIAYHITKRQRKFDVVINLHGTGTSRGCRRPCPLWVIRLPS
jgi:arginyl-tRNA synthetase